MLPDDPTIGTLLERITDLETALIETQSTATANSARAALAELRPANVSPPAPPAAQPVGRRCRGWLQRSDRSGPDYQGLGRRIKQLLALAEEQAADVVAAAQQDADQIRAAAGDDATKIRVASL